MRALRLLTAALLLAAAFDCGAPPALLTVDDFGDAGPGNCDSTCTLRDAIAVALAGGKGVTFSSAGGWPQTITLVQGELAIANSTEPNFLILGPGAANLAISANHAGRVLHIQSGTGAVIIDALTLRGGSIIGNSPGPAASGSGNSGGDGDAVFGGCVGIEAGAIVTLGRDDIRDCSANGGTGGDGGSGTSESFPSFGGTGGNGGAGGNAFGGAIAVAGQLTLDQSSIVDAHALAGDGGKGGDGGPAPPGSSGAGGVGGNGGNAGGGAIFVFGNTASLSIHDSTLAEADAVAGAGGMGGASGIFTYAGNGGDGGSAYGGLVQIDASVAGTQIEFASLVNGVAAAGAAGPAGTPGGSFLGNPGQSGNANGANLYAGGSVAALGSLVLASGSGPVCAGTLAPPGGAANLDEDGSCAGFTLHATFAQTLHRLDVTTTPWPGYVPIFNGPAIDAAACTGIGGVIVESSDQHNDPRPRGSACDLGAIESDDIFAGTFE